MSLADIEETINQLGSLSGRQGELRGLAEDVKQQQERLKHSVDAAVRLIAVFRGSSQSMRAILNRANAQKGEQEKYITELIAILNKEPSKDEVDLSIQELKSAVVGNNSSQEEIAALVESAGLSPEQVAATGIGQPDAPPQAGPPQEPVVGGFKWRTSSRRGKSSSKKSKRNKGKSSSKKITRTKSKRLTSRSKSRRRRSSKGRSY